MPNIELIVLARVVHVMAGVIWSAALLGLTVLSMAGFRYAEAIF
jgi:hypothetical protein